MQYDGEHEVIVVDKSHDKDTGEWLEEMEKLHPHLCHTFCPASSRCIDIHKLALTLGAKAAAYEWVAILPAETQLPGDEWLGRLQTCCNDQTDIVIATKGGTSLWNRLTFNLFRHLGSPSSDLRLHRPLPPQHPTSELYAAPKTEFSVFLYNNTQRFNIQYQCSPYPSSLADAWPGTSTTRSSPC